MYVFAFLPYVLQLLLIIHIIKTNKPFLWLWLLIFVPYIGGIAYIILEIVPELGANGSVSRVEGAVADMLRPNARLEALEDLARRQETIANKTALADAYTECGRYDDALALYDSCMTGPYANDRGLAFKKMQALFLSGNREQAKAEMAAFKKAALLDSQEQVLLDLQINEDYAKMEDIFYKTQNFKVGYLCAEHFHSMNQNEKVQQIVDEMKDAFKVYRRFLKRTDASLWYKKTQALLS